MAAFDYTARDYDTIKRDLLARAERVFPEWTDRDPSDFGMLLIDLWAYAADVLHYYIDRGAAEAFLPTATQRESVLAVANLLDYVPRGRTSAQATLTLTNTNTSPYVVAPYTKFLARYDSKTYNLYTENGGTIDASGNGTVEVLEGKLYEDETLTTGSTGLGGQRYVLRNTGVVASSIRVFVYEDGTTPTQYQRVPRITTADTGDKVFAINVTADNEVEIIFGTSLNGFVPPSGSLITATYAVSSGSAGNLPANSVTGWEAAAPNGVGVLSSSSFTGGVDEESITDLKRGIPNVISAQNRAVTELDFIALTTQIESVAKAAVQYLPNPGGSASATAASVMVYPQVTRGDFLTTSDTFQTVSSDLQESVVTFLQPKSMLGITVVPATTITWQPIDVQATIHVNDRYVSNWVETDVSNAIDELFEFDNVLFGQRLTLGQLYRIILNVPGVDYATISVFDEAGGSSVSTDILIDPYQLPKKGTVTLTMEGGITTSS